MAGQFGVLLDAGAQLPEENEEAAVLRLPGRVYRRVPRAFDVVSGDALYIAPRSPRRFPAAATRDLDLGPPGSPRSPRGAAPASRMPHPSSRAQRRCERTCRTLPHGADLAPGAAFG